MGTSSLTISPKKEKSKEMETKQSLVAYCEHWDIAMSDSSDFPGLVSYSD